MKVKTREQSSFIAHVEDTAKLADNWPEWKRKIMSAEASKGESEPDYVAEQTRWFVERMEQQRKEAKIHECDDLVKPELISRGDFALLLCDYGYECRNKKSWTHVGKDSRIDMRVNLVLAAFDAMKAEIERLKGEQKMKDNKYWEEVISESADDCGAVLTKEQIVEIAESASFAHENYSMAFGYTPGTSVLIDNEWKKKYEDLVKDTKQDQRKYDDAIRSACKIGHGVNFSVSPGGIVSVID